jgi:Zn-dependent protease with chaperone function
VVSASAGAAPAAAVRLLADPKILPSATTVRFSVLVMTLIASTGSIYGYIGLEAATGAQHRYASCMSGVPLQFSVSGLSSGSDAAVLSCSAPYTATIAAWTLSGIAGVALATVAAYLVLPWWTLHVTRPSWPRRSHGGRVRPWWIPGPQQPLRPLREDRSDQHAMAKRIRCLAKKSGLDTPPHCVLDPYAGAAAFVFGRKGKEYLRLGLELGSVLRTSRQVFDGIVLHELAHLRNRDNLPTFMTYAAWRVFVIVALVPYAITIIVCGALPDGHQLASVIALTVLTYLTRNAVLRVRETHADARAALVPDGLPAIRYALTDLARVQARRRRTPVVLALHPTPQQRLDDLTDQGALCKPDGLAMLAAGIALGSVATNLVFTTWVGALATTSIHGELARLAASASLSTGHALLAAAFVYGPVLLVTLPLLAGFATVTMWRAQLGALAGARQPAAIRHAAPLALGFMAGWPLSLNYAIAGTWGVFDSSAARDTADVALSALTLCILLCVMFRWAEETAAAWIPVTSGSLRRQCLVATLLAVLAASMPFFLWLLVHDNATISTISEYAVDPHMSRWPLVGWTKFLYLPLLTLSAAPACVALAALPCLYTIAGRVRPPLGAAPRWLADHTRAEELRLDRPPSRIGLALLLGVIAAITGSALALGYVIALRAALGVALTRYPPDGLPYVVNITMWLLLSVSVVLAIIAARVAQAGRLTIGLLTVLVGTALGSPFVTAAVFVGACGHTALSCAERGNNLPFLYGYIGSTAPLEGVIVVVFVLLWSHSAAYPVDVPGGDAAGSAVLPGRRGGAVVVVLVCLALVATAYYSATYWLQL